MKAKDTVIDISYASRDDIVRDIDKMLLTQAEIAFKAGEDKGKQEGFDKVVPFAEKFLTLAEHGDYANGNVAYGVDEGRVQAGELLDAYREEWQAFLKKRLEK